MLEPFKELGLDSQRVKKLASKLHLHSVNFAAKLVHTRRALLSKLLSTLIRSRVQAKPAILLIPIDFPSLLAVEELYGTRYQSGSFSLIDVGSGFHCLRSFFFFLLTGICNKNVGWVNRASLLICALLGALLLMKGNSHQARL